MAILETLLRKTGRGISTVIIALVVLVVILAAGLGYLLVSPTSTSVTQTVTSTVTTGGGTGSQGTTVTVTSTVSATGSAGGDLVALAKAEGGTLTDYSIINPGTYNSVVLPNFLKAYPWAKVNYVSLDPAGTITRPTAEFKAGKVVADVVETGNLARQLQDVANGVCAPVNMTSYLQAQGYPPESYDPKGYWYTWDINPTVIIYNTNLVPAGQAPKAYTDLANPQWKGKVAIDKPQSLSTAGLILASQYPLMGNASWTQFMKNLAANNVAFQSSGGTVETLVSQGQYAIGLDTLNGAVSAIQSGQPIKIAFPQPTEVGEGTTCIAAGAPHPHMAQLYIQWMLSYPAQVALTKGGSPSAVPAILSYAASNIIPSNVTLAADVVKTTYYTNSSAWVNIFTSLFGQ